MSANEDNNVSLVAVNQSNAATRDRVLLQLTNLQGSRIQRLTSRLGFSQISRLFHRLDQYRKRNPSVIKPYCYLVTSNNDYSDFHNFSNLPIELRLKIWKIYADNLAPRDIPIWCVRNPEFHQYTLRCINFYDSDSKLTQSIHTYEFKWVCPQPPMLFVNAEAREIALRYYTQSSFNGIVPSKKAISSATGPATIYRHINGKDRIMPMFDRSHSHDHFWLEHKHHLEGRVALNAFLYDLDPNQPILPRKPVRSIDPFTDRERREAYDLEVAQAWAAVVPSTALPPRDRVIGKSQPYYINEITIYYRTDSLMGIKDFTWGIIDALRLDDYEGCQAMRNMERAVKCAYERWESLRYNFWIRYTDNMNPETFDELMAELSSPELKKMLYHSQLLCLQMVRDSPLLQQKYAARLTHSLANPRTKWPAHLEAMWEARVPVLPKIQFAICRIANVGMAGVVRPAAYKLS